MVGNSNAFDVKVVMCPCACHLW